MKTTNTNSVITLAIASALGSGTVLAAGNPFGMQMLERGYQLAETTGSTGAVPEGKCGAKKMEEGKCAAHAGSGKTQEGKCAATAAGMDKAKEGKGGEGKCGADKASPADAMPE